MEEKKMADMPKKLVEIRENLCKNRSNLLAEKLGISPQVLSNIISGKRGVGKKTADRILVAFPEISPLWLYKDEGPMLVADNGAQVITGDNNHHNTTNSVNDRLLSIIEQDQRERLELLAIISQLADK